MPKLEKLAGVTSEIWQVFVQDASSTTGAGLTGLAFNTASLTAYYHRDTDTTATAITLVTMTVGTFTSSGFKEIDATTMPGWYQVCPPNAALAAGAKSCAIHLKGATNMAPLALEVQLVAVNPDDAVRMGLTALPNATAGANTGLAVVGTQIPNATAGAANGLFIAGTNAATAVSTSFTINGTPMVAQTGDSFARIGSGGASLTALGDTRIANLDTNVGSRMATYTQPSGFLAAAFPTTVASPTNITAGTITTVTNLTNAPTVGDFTATMKTSITTAASSATPVCTVSGDLSATMKASVTTAATAATPIAASVSGAVGSVTGNVGGNVVGSVGSVAGAVASVTARVSANLTAINGTTVNGNGSTTPWGP